MFLCTANVCRSPLAEAMLRARLVDREPTVSVTSAGVLARPGPVDPRTAEQLRARHLPVPPTTGRRVDRRLLGQADLVIGMARHHVREAVVFDRGVFPRGFTLKELVERAETLGPRQPDESFRAWLARAHEGRSTAQLLDESGGVDVADPVVPGARTFDRTAAEIDELLGRLVELAWPRAAAPAAAPAPEAAPEAPAPETPARVDPPAPTDASIAAVSPPVPLAVGADLAGSRLKAALLEHAAAHGPVVELGGEAQHYVELGAAMARAVASGRASKGLCVCGTGTGAAMAANRVRGARAAVVHDATSARLARRYHDANIMCIGSRLVSLAVAKDALDAFLGTSFDARYARDVARLGNVGGGAPRSDI